MTDRLANLAAEVLERARGMGLQIATAESCTGGLAAAALTSVAGSSDVFERGFVTYANEAKTEMLGVPPALLAEHGAVSRQVALAMAEGALRHSRAQLAVSVTGVAGPGGGSLEKPVGLVHFAAAKLVSRRPRSVACVTLHREERFGDLGRDAVRAKSVDTALQMLLEAAALPAAIPLAPRRRTVRAAPDRAGQPESEARKRRGSKS